MSNVLLNSKEKQIDVRKVERHKRHLTNFTRESKTFQFYSYF